MCDFFPRLPAACPAMQCLFETLFKPLRYLRHFVQTSFWSEGVSRRVASSTGAFGLLAQLRSLLVYCLAFLVTCAARLYRFWVTHRVQSAVLLLVSRHGHSAEAESFQTTRLSGLTLGDLWERTLWVKKASSMTGAFYILA